MIKSQVVIGLLGPTLDRGQGPQRWAQWRPSVALCQHDELLMHRFELLYQPAFTTLAQVVLADIGTVSPETEVCLRPIIFDDPWDFEQVLRRLVRFCPQLCLSARARKTIWCIITTGTHVAQICLYLLTESHPPARQVAPGLTPAPTQPRGTGSVQDYRPRFIQIRSARGSISAGATRRDGAIKIRNQNPQLRVQSPHRAN